MDWEDRYHGGVSGRPKRAGNQARRPRLNDDYPLPYRFGLFPKFSPPFRRGEQWIVRLIYPLNVEEHPFDTEKEAHEFHSKKTA